MKAQKNIPARMRFSTLRAFEDQLENNRRDLRHGGRRGHGDVGDRPGTEGDGKSVEALVGLPSGHDGLHALGLLFLAQLFYVPFVILSDAVHAVPPLPFSAKVDADAARAGLCLEHARRRHRHWLPRLIIQRLENVRFAVMALCKVADV